jgi:hypothetical protein
VEVGEGAEAAAEVEEAEVVQPLEAYRYYFHHQIHSQALKPTSWLLELVSAYPQIDTLCLRL